MTSIDQLVLRPVDPDRDIDALVRMWQASDDQWPGTFSNGVPISADWVRDWLTRQQAIEILVWQDGDEIAGYCSLWAKADEPHVTYVKTLNVPPAYQKLGLARRFLTHCVRHSVELGARRLDLHTWPGNLKAVPLYKKCGFCWRPGTGVDMQNYMPAILAMPLARPFFERHDWYTTLRRELTQAEDHETWQGMGVFTYRFEAGDECLTVWAEREARTITAIDTGALFAAAIVADPHPPRGLATTMRWRLANRRGRPVDVSLIATGTAEIHLDHRASLTLAPGEEVELSAPVTVPAGMPEIDRDHPAPALRSLLVIDGELLELGTGVRPRPAVAARLAPEFTVLTPGVARQVHVELESRLDRPVQVQLGVTPAAGLTADWHSRVLELEASETAAVPLALTAAHDGAFALPLSVTITHQDTRTALPPTPARVLALAPGGVAGVATSDRVWIENHDLRLTLDRRGAFLQVFEPLTGDRLVLGKGWPMPPVRPNEYESAEFELVLERRDGALAAVARYAARSRPGIVLERRVTVGGGAIVTIEHEIENLGTEPYQFQLFQWIDWYGMRATTVLPLTAGLGREQWSLFPQSTDDRLGTAPAYAEPWAALEFNQSVVGFLWSADLETIDFNDIEFISRAYEVPAQQRVRVQPLRLYCGPGDWRTVRRAWQRLSGRTGDEPVPAVQPPLGARCDPPVVVAGSREVTADLVVNHLRAWPWSGNVTLALPPGWQAGQTSFAPQAVTWQAPFRVPLHLQAPGRPGAAHASLVVRSAEYDSETTVPLLCLGDGRDVQVQAGRDAHGPILTVDNGLLQYDVTPAFAGILRSLRYGGRDQLASPYPAVGTIDWMSPWHGGITPILVESDDANIPGRLVHEQFEASPYTLETPGGITWRGVQLACTPLHEDLRGLRVELEFLTTGGSPVVRMVLRVRNRGALTRRLGDAGWLVFAQPGGDRAGAELVSPGRQLKPDARIYWLRAGRWAAAHSPTQGHALALIAPAPAVGLITWGTAGRDLALLEQCVLPANGTWERVSYLVAGENLASVQAFIPLSQA